MAEDEGEDHRSIEACTTAQAMIDINAKHLDGLRTQCPPSAELTQHEIRSVESKLIKLFSRQLIAKYKCPNREALKELEQYPRLRLWLQVVGLSLKCIEGISQEIETMDELLRMSEHNLKEIMHKVNARDEEIRRMLIALRNLKTYTDRQLQGEVSTATDLELHWESWDRNSGVGTSPRSYHRTRAARSSVPSEELLKGTPVSPPSNHGHHMSSSSGHISVSSTAMYHGLSSTIPNYGSASLTPNSRECRYTPPPTPPIMGKKGDKRFPTTPPPSKKHQTTLLPEFPLTKSKSHEEHLANRIEHMDSLQNKGENIPRRRLATEPGLESSGLFGQMSPLMSSPNRSPPFISPDQQSDGCFVDEIPSQNILPVPRSPRTQGMGHSIHHRFTPTLKVTICQLCDKPMFFGVKCKECKFRYHRDCSEKAPPSCGLPNALVHFFSRTITNEDVSDLNKDVTLETKPFIDSEMIETQKSNDSDKTVSGTSGSTDSEKTLAGRVDSQDSQVSDVDASERSWPRQNSLSLREWDIPYDELEIIDRLGTGRFGTVYKGNWHGSVAIKVLNMDHVDDKKTLETFKQEVATFRKTRHENLVLFMGACMNPPHLAIVTSLCKGNTLYTQIHLLKDKLSLNKTVSIAQQISQGMGYLHAREIVHKDLKTRNIFYENGKVVITDFGLFSVTKLCHGNRKGEWLTIPKGWLCYLAPEVIHSLRAGNQQEGDDLPFSTASDVYAFGTVWYELLCGEWPFQGLPSEAIIWQVGKGVKQSLANIQASRDVKEILMMCWAFKSSDRPEFSKLLTILSQLPLLPKKRLARSPSHPIHLSRSAESVF
ncbi:kinase suppressor of Ras 1-like isoform X3 [Centruroides sculpturatus]|uniref:kinase suppressor of Ras 1-like isoform X3 n=1 Tax=Centruroides sculpturatus TaxID=218467 RepID=UPI000C6D408C|nr:kinase suppressor of Ras 1-like isoform X3 [Centruroides sculpturatus]